MFIHFPISLKYVPIESRYPPEWLSDAGVMEVVPVPVTETWSAMEQLVDKGLCKAIGVSNFSCSLVNELLANGPRVGWSSQDRERDEAREPVKASLHLARVEWSTKLNLHFRNLGVFPVVQCRKYTRCGAFVADHLYVQFSCARNCNADSCWLSRPRDVYSRSE